MWAYSFMQNALIAGLLISIICGIVSVLVIIRRSAFATHAMGHMSLTGATGATLIGISVIGGQLILNIIAALIMGLMGAQLKKNDLTIGVVLSFVLGLGIYFLFLLQNSYAGGVINILFGNLLIVSAQQIYSLIILALITLVILLIFSKPLFFASLDPVVATAKNISTRNLSILFFIILALTVSMACQVVGALLIFVLLVIPGAIAVQWGRGFYSITFISITAANIAVVLSLYFAYYFDLPISFCITMLLSLFYVLSILANKIIYK